MKYFFVLCLLVLFVHTAMVQGEGTGKQRSQMRNKYYAISNFQNYKLISIYNIVLHYIGCHGVTVDGFCRSSVHCPAACRRANPSCKSGVCINPGKQGSRCECN